MTKMYRKNLAVTRGFWPSAGLVGAERVADSIIDGQNVLFLGPGYMKSARGCMLQGSPGGDRMYLVGSKLGYIQGANSTGSVVPYKGDSYWYLSTGASAIGIGAINSGALTLPDTAGKLMLYYNGVSYPAGLAAPTNPPTVAAGGASTKMSGDYGVVITAYRSTTGAESNGSPPSATVSLNNKQLVITFANTPVVGSGQDMWGIYVTPRGFATTGPFFFYKYVPVGSSSVTIDIYDTETIPTTPPTTNFPPPTGQFVVALGNVMTVLGSYGGATTGVAAGISPCMPGFPEAFPPLNTSYLNPQESIIGFAARPTEGELILWTNNSVQSLVLTGAQTLAPLIARAIWPTLGIQSKHGGCFTDDGFYAFSGTAGPVRMSAGGEPDTSFAAPVRDYIRTLGWNPANVVVGYDPVYDAVIYAHGNTALPFMRSLQGPAQAGFYVPTRGYWSTPVNLNFGGTVVSAITYQGALYLGTSTGGLAAWEVNNGSPQPWFLRTSWQDDPDPQDRKTFTGWRVNTDMGNTQLTSQLYTDEDATTVQASFTDTASGPHYTNWKRTNKRCRSYSIKNSGSGSDQFVYDVESSYLYEPGVRERK